MLGKGSGVTRTVLADRQPPTVAFTMLAVRFGPMANETEISVDLFSKEDRQRNLEFGFFDIPVEHYLIWKRKSSHYFVRLFLTSTTRVIALFKKSW